MRRCALFAGVLGALIVGLPAEPAPGACAASVKVGDDLYVPYHARQALPLGGRLSGVLPACNDVVGAPGPPERDQRVSLRTVRGIPAALAVVRPEQRSLAYAVIGTFPQLRGHPLARYLPRPAAARRCGGRESRGGRVSVTPGFGPLVVDGRPIGVRRGTTIRGARDRAGQPQILQGDLVAVTGRRCRQAGERRLVASRIDVTPRR